ncbi:hypothetical protein DFJ77DRAFT_465249 [Powellomyces hirtus]|nr:hypothetical protein DFJ77DRAFT_465249 [Powellomyces hirtus]
MFSFTKFKIRPSYAVTGLVLLGLVIAAISVLTTASCSCSCEGRSKVEFTLNGLTHSAEQCTAAAPGLGFPRSCNGGLYEVSCTVYTLTTIVACLFIVAAAAAYVVITRRIRQNYERRERREMNLNAALQPQTNELPASHGGRHNDTVNIRLPAYERWHNPDEETSPVHQPPVTVRVEYPPPAKVADRLGGWGPAQGQ